MVCKECKNKPLVRGISQVICAMCGKDSATMYGDFNICNDCSDEYARCKRCGKKILKEENNKSRLNVLYDSDEVTIDLLKNYEDVTSIRISYFKGNHWIGESWVDDVFSQENSKFRKDL